MSIFQPVSLAARRAFWPSLPMARDSWSSGTTTRQLLPSGRGSTADHVGGRQSGGNVLGRIVGVLDNVHLLALELLHDGVDTLTAGADTGADGIYVGVADQTASLVREPASRAMERISTVPS